MSQDISSKLKVKDVGNRGLSKNDYSDTEKGLVSNIQLLNPGEKYNYGPVIQQVPDYTLNYRTDLAYKNMSTWYFAKSSKKIDSIGVFIVKRSSLGTISSPVIVQVIHTRNSVSTKILNATLAPSELATHDDLDVITDHRKSEVIIPLTIPVTLLGGDTLFINIFSDSSLNPYYSDTNKDLSSGEWNNGVGNYYRNWNNSAFADYSIPATLPVVAGNPGVITFYENSSEPTLGRIDQIEDLLGKTAKYTSQANIQQVPNYALNGWFASTYNNMSGWYFGKSTKTINKIGVFIFKRSSLGTISSDVIVQVLHKRGSVETDLLQVSLTAASLATNDDVDTITNYANYEVIIPLDHSITIQNGDSIFINIYSASGLNPIYSDTNKNVLTGEWNNATGANYRTWSNNAYTNYTSVPALPGTVGSNPMVFNFYEQGETTVFERLDEIESKIGVDPIGTLDFDVLAPEVIYISDNVLAGGFNGRRTPVKVYLSHFIRDKIEIWLNKGFNEVITNRDIVSTVNVEDSTLTITIGGGAYVTKTLTIALKIIKESILASQVVLLQYIGDSIGENRLRNGIVAGAGSLWAWCLEVAGKNKIDNANTGYDIKSLGRKFTINTSIAYKAGTITLKGGAESIGGWSTHNWLRHPFRITTTDPNTRQGGWDLLGLKAQTGFDYTNTYSNMLLMTKTCYGVNTPVISQYSYNTLIERGQITSLGTWTGASNQIASVQAWIDNVNVNPENGFFDLNKTGSNRFSYAKYLERHRTLLANGITRATTTKGTRITDTNSIDVCEPTHIVINLGENDMNTMRDDVIPSNGYNAIVDDILELAAEIKLFASSIPIAVCLTDRPGPMFPERTTNYKGILDLTAHGKKYDFYKILVSRLGNFATQSTNKIFLLPTWHTMQPNSHSLTSFQIDEGTGQEIQIANPDYTHPGYYGLRSAGNQLYAWLALIGSL